MSGFDRVRLQHVPREQNREADRLANLGVDLRGSGSANRVTTGTRMDQVLSANSNVRGAARAPERHPHRQPIRSGLRRERHDPFRRPPAVDPCGATT